MQAVVLRTATAASPHVSAGSKWVAVLSGLGLLLLIYLATMVRTSYRNPWKLVEGADGAASTSKFQWFLWIIVILFAYTALWVLRAEQNNFAALSEIPVNLLTVLGFSTGTAAAAKGITSGYVQNGRVAKAPPPPKAAAGAAPVVAAPAAAAPAPGDAIAGNGGILQDDSGVPELPAYISAESFSAAIIDLLVPNAAGKTTMAEVQNGIGELPEWMPTLKSSLQALATNAGQDIDLFRTSVEKWYDDHMSRVSGWYKRHVAKITIVVGAILVLLLNINTLTIGRTLWNSSVVSTAVSTVAAKTTTCQNQSQQDCLAGLQEQLSAAAQAGLPIGWATVPACAVPKTSCTLAAAAGDPQPLRRFRLATRACPHRLPDHDHGTHPRCPVLVRPPGQARQPPLDRPQARRARRARKLTRARGTPVRDK